MFAKDNDLTRGTDVEWLHGLKEGRYLLGTATGDVRMFLILRPVAKSCPARIPRCSCAELSKNMAVLGSQLPHTFFFRASNKQISKMSAVQLSKDALTLKPIIPTQFWTFDNALALLRSCTDPYILDALDEFLMLNNDLLKNPRPLSSTDSTTVKKETKDILLHNITYSLELKNIDDANKIREILDLDLREVLRVVSQTCKRIPEKKITDITKLKSKLPDDREKNLENERLYLYASKVLRERRTILKIVVELLNNKTNEYASTIVQNLGKDIFLSKKYLDGLISALRDSAELLISKPKSGVSAKIDELIFNETKLFMIELCRVGVEVLIQNPNVGPDATKGWFAFMDLNSFGLTFGPYFLEQSFAFLQGLITVISVLFLDLAHAFPTNTNSVTKAGAPTTIFADTSAFLAANDAITSVSNANTVIMYSWSIVLLRQFYFTQEYPSNELAKKLPITETAIKSLNDRSITVFEDIYRLNELLKFDNIFSTILSSVIVAAIPLVTFTPEITNTIENVLLNCPNGIIEKFFDDESTLTQIVLARAKFPLLLTPYLKIASINGNFAFHEFNDLKSIIAKFTKKEFSQLYEIDDENPDLVKLSSAIDVYPPFEINKKLSFLLSAGTKAKILPAATDDEILVTFLYKYNGWAFLGRVLQNVSKIFNTADSEKVEVVVDILHLLTRVCMDSSVDDVKTVLEAMSVCTDDSDIVEVILRLLEQGLHSREVRVLEVVLDLLTQLFPFLSYRIWPFLAKSALLSRNGKEGFASIIFGAIEMVNGDYKFTVAFIKFIYATIENCLILSDDYPEKAKGIIMTKFIEHLLLVFESFVYCRFNKAYQKMEIGVLVLDAFTKILASAYGYTDIVKPLNASVKAILDSFLVASNDNARSAVPIIAMTDTLCSDLSANEISDLSGFWHENWVRCSLAFSLLIITIRTHANYPPSSLEKELFRKLPQLVLIYSLHSNLRKDVLEVITALTNGKWPDESKPSLLAHLGRDHAQVLLHSISADLDNSFDDYRIKIALYDFICAVLEGNQEGLAVLFISGRDVFGDFSGDLNHDSNTSLLHILKKNVNDMKYYPNSVSVHLLEALALACNTWSTSRDKDDEDFIDELVTRIQLQITEPPSSSDDYVSRCYEIKIVSKIAEILSLILFTTRNECTRKKIIKLLTMDTFIETIMLKFVILSPIKEDNTFEEVFSGFKLQQFQAHLVKRNRVGFNTVYNLSLMDSYFQNNLQWLAVKESIKNASLKEQYTYAQVAVAKSFACLVTAFCRRSSSALHSKHIGLVPHLLKMNLVNGEIKEMFHVRIELAFFVMYSLYNRSDLKKDRNDLFNILKVSLELLSLERLEYFNSLVTLQGYYRPLLRIIYCCLNLVKDDDALLLEYFSVFKELFDIVITKSAKVLLIEVQNDVYLSHTDKNHTPQHMNAKIDDLMLVLSILKIFVNMKTSGDLDYEMSILVNDNGTIRALLHTFSLSHYIEANEDYILAQIALMFIQQLMSIEVIAEKIVLSALFLALVESPISSPLRVGNVSIDSNPQHHRIWNNGILPVIISALSKLGPAVLPDVCVTLSLFSKQIGFCLGNWSRDSQSIKINSAIVAETGQILLIYDLLTRMNVVEYLQLNNSDGKLDFLPGLETAVKREEFVECINNLLKHPKFLASRISPATVEEQRIIEKRGDAHNLLMSNVISEIRDLKDFFE